MAEKLALKVDKRDITGKKVRFLRRDGVIPVHMFGNNQDSLPLQASNDDLKKILSEAGRTRIIDLKVGGSKAKHAVMVREVQRDPVKGDLLHVDFYQVNLKENIRVEVPIVFTGEAPILRDKDYTLLRELDNLHIECLPEKMPDQIEVDISRLEEPDQAIRIKDIQSPDYTILNDHEVMVAKVTMAHVSSEKEEAEAGEQAETAAEAPAQET
jgi:large subunit ribosomal protein L25